MDTITKLNIDNQHLKIIIGGFIALKYIRYAAKAHKASVMTYEDVREEACKSVNVMDSTKWELQNEDIKINSKFLLQKKDNLEDPVWFHSCVSVPLQNIQ